MNELTLTLLADAVDRLQARMPPEIRDAEILGQHLYARLKDEGGVMVQFLHQESVRLQVAYFKASGKYYSEDDETKVTVSVINRLIRRQDGTVFLDRTVVTYEVVDAFKDWVVQHGHLPGLSSGGWEGTTTIQAPDLVPILFPPGTFPYPEAIRSREG